MVSMSLSGHKAREKDINCSSASSVFWSMRNPNKACLLSEMFFLIVSCREDGYNERRLTFEDSFLI